jgi:hypothetical protein
MQDDAALFIDYNDLARDPVPVIERIAAHAEFSVTKKTIAETISKAKEKSIRLNVGITGRGAGLSEPAARILNQYLEFYPELKETPLYKHA